MAVVGGGGGGSLNRKYSRNWSTWSTIPLNFKYHRLLVVQDTALYCSWEMHSALDYKNS